MGPLRATLSSGSPWMPRVFCAHALNSTVQPGAACGAVPPLVAWKRKKKWRQLWCLFCFMQMQSHQTQILPEHLRMSPSCLWHQSPMPDLQIDSVAQTSPSLWDKHWQLQAWEAFTDTTNVTRSRHCTRDRAEGCQGSTLKQPRQHSL